jgi:site-specific DNA recombinase
MTPVELPFAFYGRVSTEDLQDPRASAAWQKGLSTQLIQPFGGKITSEFFDVGMSRSIPWRRRPHASRLLDDLPNPNRGYSRVVIGEPQRAFYDSQFGQLFPLSITTALSSGSQKLVAGLIQTTTSTN